MRKTVKVFEAFMFCFALFVILNVPIAMMETMQLQITINHDGTVEPDMGAIEKKGDVYSLVENIGSIVINRSDIVLDGNGHTLSGEYAVGVYLWKVSNVTVNNLNIIDGKIGINLDNSSYVTISDNTITGTFAHVSQLDITGAIIILGGNSNSIAGNRIANNVRGIWLIDSEHNTVTENSILNNSEGIVFRDASNNIIYQNNFVNNSVQVYDTGMNSITQPYVSVNIWDKSGAGNYWSDYNGTGDTPYIINESNIDHYPLTKSFDANPVFPTMWVIIAVILFVSVGGGFVLYLKKRRSKIKRSSTLTYADSFYRIRWFRLESR
jgi:parallel beta-helix repeat protein